MLSVYNFGSSLGCWNYLSFLGNIRATIVPAVTLPVSLIGACLGLWIFGLTINVFTLLAIILSVAIVTDDSVVMTESIYHRVEQGDTPLSAAATGSKNVIFAILSTSIILLATFALYYLLVELVEHCLGKWQ